jgi:hypothetical protein
VNLLKNDIPVEQAQELVKIMQSKEKLVTLCGLSRKEATLDFSKQGLGPGDTVLIANDISDMGALSSLNLALNHLTRGTLKPMNAPCISEKQWANQESSYKRNTEGLIALANAIPDMGVLTSLNLSSNYLEAEGGKIVAEAIKVTNCAIAVILAPFSCPSGRWLNCCCLLLSTGYEGPIISKSCSEQPWAVSLRRRLGPGTQIPKTLQKPRWRKPYRRNA